MKVLVVTRSLPFHHIGGMEAVAWDVARGLARRTCEVKVLTTSCERLPPKSKIENVEIECLPVPSGRYSRKWWSATKAIYQDRVALDTDIVLSISAGAMSMATSRKPHDKPRFIVQAHGTAWGELVSKLRAPTARSLAGTLRNIKAMWDDRGYRQFDSFIAVGDNVLRDLRRRPTCWVLGDIPIALIRNGIDPQVFAFSQELRGQTRKRLTLSHSDTVVVSVCRLHAQKGLSGGLKGVALAIKNNSSLKYLIIGSGPLELDLRHEAKTLGIEDRVTFCGQISRDEIPAYLSAADVFLFPTTRIEGLPLNILEALACGLPCILSVQVTTDLLPTTAINPQNYAEIAQAINSTPLCKDRNSKLPIDFTIDNSADLHLGLFNSLLNGHHV